MSIRRNTVIAFGVAAVVGLGAVGVARAHSRSVSHASAAPAVTVVRHVRYRFLHPGVALFLHRVTTAQATVDIAGTDHTVRLDHGVVQSAGAGQIVLVEGGSTTVTIPVAATALVRFDGRRVALASLHSGDVAYAVRVDGRAARGVRAFGPNSAS
jgi:hypothetical protein